MQSSAYNVVLWGLSLNSLRVTNWDDDLTDTAVKSLNRKNKKVYLQ